MTMQALATTKAEAFAERMLTIFKNGTFALMTSIGHHIKLFDTMAELPPSISQQIADAAKLNEYYVREWLSAIVTGWIVDHDHSEKQYVQTLCACNKVCRCLLGFACL